MVDSLDDNLVSIEKAILADVCLGVPLGKIVFQVPSHMEPGEIGAGPDTFLFRGEQLALMKALHERGDERIAVAVAALARSADNASLIDPFSVTQKPHSRFSNDRRDYQSLAKYWWPHSDSTSGLPYVKRDGEVNPECYSEDFDYVRLVRFSETVTLLALAAYLTGRVEYGKRAALLLETWFVDPETRQTPHFNFAQMSPGRDAVRRQAVIESRFLIYVTEAVQLLAQAGALTTESEAKIRVWFATLLEWLRESELGRKAKDAKNNIGFWYDLQCMVYAQFCGKMPMAEMIARDEVVPRLNAQIADNGTLPGELGRSYPMDYVAFTLAAMALISRLGERSGLELWDQRQGDGRNFQVAHDWLLKASNARRLLSGISATGKGVDGAAPDMTLLLDLGIKLRAFQRVAEIEGRTAARARTELANTLAIQMKREAEIKLLKQHLDDVRANVQGLRAECKTQKRRLTVLENERETQDQRLKGLEKEREAARDLVKDRDALLAWGRDLEGRYRAVLQSTSWFVTGPARAIARGIKHLLTGHRPQRSRVPRSPRLLSARYGAKTNRGGSEQGRPAAAKDPLETLRNAKPHNEEALKREYAESGLDMEPDTFVLYRIIGNDLSPRHKKGQSRENVLFILANEPNLADCEKRWVVNRIIDPDEERQIIAMLEAHGQTFIHIPFVAEEYLKIGWDFDAMPEPGFLASHQFQKLQEQEPRLLHERGIAALYRLKNNYVMNNNGARNAAVADGRRRAKWVLPWDGNCFVTSKAWQEIQQEVKARPHLKYYVVPMERITDNAMLLRNDLAPHPIDEPQLLFRRDARESFNPEFPYGRRPKIELLWRLGIPGSWDRWRDDPWEQKPRGLSPEAHQFGVAGWVARLFSGVETLEQKNNEGMKRRGQARQDAIIATIDRVDGLVHSAAPDPDGLTFYPRKALDCAKLSLQQNNGPWLSLAARIVADAEYALAEEPHSAIEKTTLPPSSDPHDYWHPAPYWWPDLSKPHGIPYIKKDGQRVPGTLLYEPDSSKYDRTRLQLMFDGTTALALGWYLTGRADFAAHGARLVRTWFLDPATRMNPHMLYSQVRRGYDNDEGCESGIIELKDLYYVLDAVRLLERSDAFGLEDSDGLKTWLRDYLLWLETSKQGTKEVASRNNHGTYFDLQAAAIAAYLGERTKLRDIFLRAQCRIAQQFTETGEQTEEMTRSLTQHYVFFNLQGWLNIFHIAKANGLPTGDWVTEPYARIAAAFRWIMRHDMKNWPYEQIEPFDTDRVFPLAASALRLGLASTEEMTSLVGETQFHSRKPVFYPHDGVRPYWLVGITPRDVSTERRQLRRVTVPTNLPSAGPSASANRVLLCIPLGGLNDTLCQIEKCWRYAKRFNRQLVIDTRRSGLMGQFFDYFSMRRSSEVDVVGRLDPCQLACLNEFDCYPQELRGRLDSYTATYRRERSTGVYRDADTGVALSFDFSFDYSHSLLIHHQAGGGTLSRSLLDRIALSDAVLADVTERLSALPHEYLGIHVRNTDLKTDYESFFQRIYPVTIDRTVLICSDDPNVITRAKDVLDISDVITTIEGRPEGNPNRPLHSSRYQNDSEKRSQAIYALVDLLALGGASDVLIAKCSNKNGYSGFSNLSLYLSKNKHVISSLLSTPHNLTEFESYLEGRK